MTLASIDRDKIRFDAKKKPVVKVDGLKGTGHLSFADQFQVSVTDGDNKIQFPNRTVFNGDLQLIETDIPQLKASSGLTKSDGVLRSEGEGWTGAYHEQPLFEDHAIVLMPASDLNKITGLALLDTEHPVVHNYLDDTVPHAMIFGLNGLGQILENGILQHEFRYHDGDIAQIGMSNGITKYSLRHTDGLLTHLYASVSKVKKAPLAHALAYSRGSEIKDLSVMSDRVQVEPINQFLSSGIMMPVNLTITQGGISTIGILRNFQDWNNDFYITSTADSLTLADNNQQYTFPNVKKRLRTISPNLATRDKTYRLDLETFFNYHGIEIDFVFVDEAKTDVSSNHTYWWARFQSPFGDKSRNSCLSAHTAQIIETYNTASIPTP